MAADRDGNIYIAPYASSAIYTVDGKGVMKTLAGDSVDRRFADGAREVARFRNIIGLAVDPFALRGSERRAPVRAIGPGLKPFVPELQTVEDPRRELVDSRGSRLADNDNWGGTTTLIDSFKSVGAFPLRGLGPALTRALADPVLTVHDHFGNLVSRISCWQPYLGDIFLHAGITSFAPESQDAAALLMLSPGSYTLQLSSSSGAAGQGQIEVRDVR